MTTHQTPFEGLSEDRSGRAWAVDVRGLRRSYGDHVVIDGIDLRLEAGSVLSLLGPNGASAARC